MDGVDPRKRLEALAAHEKGASGDGMDRRYFERYTVRGEATITPDARWASTMNPDDWVVDIRDVSRGGLGVVTRGKMHVGRPYRLVCVAEGVELFSAEVTPRHVKALPEGMWSAGVAFLAEGAWLVALGVPASLLRTSEAKPDTSTGDGDFSGVAA